MQMTQYFPHARMKTDHLVNYITKLFYFQFLEGQKTTQNLHCLVSMLAHLKHCPNGFAHRSFDSDVSFSASIILIGTRAKLAEAW